MWSVESVGQHRGTSDSDPIKVAQEQQRLETMTAQIAQTEQTLNDTQAAIEKKEKELQSLQKQAKEQHTAALTVQEIRSMEKKDHYRQCLIHSIRVQYPQGLCSHCGLLIKAETATWKKSCTAPNGVLPSGNRDTMPCTTHTTN